MNLREIFVALGLEWDAAGFAEALTAEKLLEKGAELLVEAFKEIPAQLIETIAKTAEYGSAVNDASARTGIAVGRLQELGFAAKLSGSSQEDMWMALTRLSHTMGQAAGGSKEAADAFAALHVSVTDGNGKLKASDQVFSELAARLGEIKNPTERASKAFGVFNRQASGLLPMFAEGEKGLEAMVDRYNDLGIAMSEEGTKKSDEFGDSIDTVRAVLESFRHDVGLVLIDALQPVIDLTLDWIAANRELIRSKLQAFAQGVVTVAKVLARTFAVLVKLGDFLVENWKLLAVIMGSFLIAKFVILNAMLLEQLVGWALNTAAALMYGGTVAMVGLEAAGAWLAAAAPVVLMTALLAILALAAEDIYVFLKGGDSLIGDLGRKWTTFLDSWLADDTGDGWLMTALKAVIWLLSDITTRFPRAIAEWKDMIVRFFTETIPNAVRDFVGKFPGLLDPLNLGGRTFGAAMHDKFPGAGGLFSGGAAGPEAAAASSSAASSVGVLAPTFHAGGITVVANPGQDTEQVAGAVEAHLDDWWTRKTSEAAAAAGGG